MKQQLAKYLAKHPLGKVLDILEQHVDADEVVQHIKGGAKRFEAGEESYSILSDARAKDPLKLLGTYASILDATETIELLNSVE
jgi:hypothetical protein